MKLRMLVAVMSLAGSALAQIGIAPNSTGTSLNAASQTGRGTCFRLTRDEYSRPATAFAFTVSTSGSPTAYTVLMEGTEIGTGADAVTLGTINEATAQTIYISNVFPKAVCANLTAISGGTSPKITAKISPIANSSALPGVSADGKGGVRLSGQLETGAEYDNGTCSTAADIDPSNGNRQKITLTASSTCALVFTQPSSGTVSVQLKVVQAAGGGGTISGGKWSGGTVPIITATAGAVDIITAYLDGTDAYCVASQDFR
jgi:hypothetical protein